MTSGRSLWEHVIGWWTENARHHVYAPIPKERTGEAYDDAPLEPGGSYFRLWLSEMFLTKRVAWGTEWFPAVTSEVRLQFGGQSVSFSRVAQPPLDQLGEGVRLDYRLTELLPFNGGVVEIEAALLGLKGADYLGTAIGILQQFSSLITPPLGPAVSLAQAVVSGTRDLLSATKGKIHLGFHQELISGGAGGAVLRPGYLAVILAEPGQVSPDRLSVRDGRLYYRKAPGQEPGQPQGIRLPAAARRGAPGAGRLAAQGHPGPAEHGRRGPARGTAEHGEGERLPDGRAGCRLAVPRPRPARPAAGGGGHQGRTPRARRRGRRGRGRRRTHAR